MFRKFILLIGPLLFAAPAAAGLISFTLDLSSISTLPGGTYNPTCQNLATLECVIFTGNFAFTGDQDYYATDIDIVMDPSNPDSGADVVGNDNYFQGTVAGIFGPDGAGSSYSGGLFEIDVDPSSPYGVYNGTATLVATDSDSNPITGPDTVVSFQVDVTPEPAMGMLMVAGLASLAAIGRRYRRK